jgi:hypothetical protein
MCRSGKAAQHGKEDQVMTVIQRNGISGLVLRLATIAAAAIMFGCAPKADAAQQASAPSFVQVR